MAMVSTLSIGATGTATVAVLMVLALLGETSDASADTCPKPRLLPPEVLETELRDRLTVPAPLVDFQNTGGDEEPGVQIFSMNARSEHCEWYPGGNDALRHEASIGIDEGLRCLANLGTRYPNGSRTAAIRNEVSQLLGYFDARRSSTSFTFVCALNLAAVEEPFALAIPCQSDAALFGGTAPGMVLNVQKLDGKSSQGRSSTVFHELLHLLGYGHLGGFDFVKTAQACCFSGSDAACEHIANNAHGDPPRLP